MTTARRRSALTLAAVAAAVSAIFVAPSSALASCTPKLTPTTIAVGKTSKTVTFDVASCGGTAVAYWGVTDKESTGPFFYAYETAPQVTFFTGEYNDLTNKLAGAHTVEVTAYDADYNQLADVAMTLKFLRSTYWSGFNASPEPVKKGAKIHFTGDLRRINWDTNKYQAYGSHTVHIQRKLAGGDYVDYKTVKTDSRGHLSATVTATRTATWRMRSGANSITGHSYSSGDGVVVK